MAVRISTRFGGTPNCTTLLGDTKIVQSDTQSIRRCAESIQGFPDAVRILQGGIDPDNEVLRCPRNAVRRECVGSDDKESDLRVQERDYEIEPVVGHLDRITLTGHSARGMFGHGLPDSSHARLVSSATISTRSAAVVVAERSWGGSAPSE